MTAPTSWPSWTFWHLNGCLKRILKNISQWMLSQLLWGSKIKKKYSATNTRINRPPPLLSGKLVTQLPAVEDKAWLSKFIHYETQTDEVFLVSQSSSVKRRANAMCWDIWSVSMTTNGDPWRVHDTWVSERNSRARAFVASQSFKPDFSHRREVSYL